MLENIKDLINTTRITIIPQQCLLFCFYRIPFWNVRKHMTFVDRKLGLSSNYSWLIVYPGRCTRRWRRLGSTSAVLYSSRKNKDPRAHRDGAVQFSAHECLIFNRIAAMPRWGKRKRAPWKIKFYCFLLTDKARGESSNAIDRNRSSLKQKPVQLFSFPVGRPQRHPRWLETKTNLSLLRIPFRNELHRFLSLFLLSFSFLFLIFFFYFLLLSSSLFSFSFVLFSFLVLLLSSTRKCTRDAARIGSNAFTRARKIRTTRKWTMNGLVCYVY